MSILPAPPTDQPSIPPMAPPIPSMPAMPAPAMMPPAAMPQAVMPPEIVVPQMEAPQQFDFKIPLQQADLDLVGQKYSMEIERALQARRSGAAQNFQIIGNVAEAATTAQVVANPRRPSFKSWEDEIQDLWNRYEMVPPDRDLPFDGAANYRTPLTKWMVDAVLARLMAGLATVRPIWRVEAREPAFINGAGKIEEFLDYVAEEEVNFTEWLDLALIQAGVEGAGIAYVTWITASEHQLIEEVTHVEEAITDEFGAQIGIKKTARSAIVEHDTVIESRPNVDLIPMMDFLVADPRRKHLKDQPWMGHRARLYRAEIAALKGHEGYFNDQIDKALGGGGYQPGSSSTQKADEGVDARTGIKTVNDFSQMKMLDPFDVWSLTAWYDWDLDGKPERVVLEIVMPSRILIRMIKFPYLHGRPFYVPLVLLPRPHSFYPRSLVGDLRMTQDETDAMHNHRTDATSIAISSLFMFLYDEQAGYDPSRQRISLGESIKIDGDINHIQVLAKSFRGITVPGMDIEQLLIDFGKFLTGIHEMQTGGTNEKRTTAFEVGAVIQEGNVKFRRMIERASEAMAEIAYQIIALYQQHANRSLPKMYKVLNETNSPFREIESGEMFGRWKYRVHGVALAHQRDMDVKKAMDVTQLVSTNPIFAELVMNNPRRKYHVAKTLLDKIGAPVVDIIGTEAEAMSSVPPMPGGGPTIDPEVEKKVHELQAKMASAGGISANSRPDGRVPQPGTDAGAKAVGAV